MNSLGRHGITPTHAEPWRKIFIGGSDDHGGMFAGKVFTEAAAATDSASFLTEVRAGRCTLHGGRRHPARALAQPLQ
jgi:hypothetical protein